VTPSAVSQRIKSLEQALGIVLQNALVNAVADGEVDNILGERHAMTRRTKPRCNTKQDKKASQPGLMAETLWRFPPAASEVIASRGAPAFLLLERDHAPSDNQTRILVWIFPEPGTFEF
jgi:hypothetical protein